VVVLPWLAQCLGQSAPNLHRDARGRPYVHGCAEPVDINWSHSGQALLVAAGQGGRLGVDIEWMRPKRNALALAGRFFAASEADQLRALPEDARELAFTRLWCAKEALLKAHGHGISYGLERAVFALEGEHWQLVRCDAGLGTVRDWQVFSFVPGPGYLAALAWRKG